MVLLVETVLTSFGARPGFEEALQATRDGGITAEITVPQAVQQVIAAVAAGH